MAVELLWLISYTIAALFVSCFGCILFFLAYLYYVHRRVAHIPGPPRSSFILGNIPEISKYKDVTGKTLPEYLVEKRFEYGPVFVIVLVHRAIVFLSDPNDVRHVYINNNKILCKSDFLWRKLGFIYGERGGGFGLVTNTDQTLWRKRRTLMNPAFHRKCLKDFMSNFNNVCDRFLAHMETVSDCGKPTSMVHEFAKVTLEAISQVSFNINTNAIELPDSPFPDAIRNYLQGVQDNINIPLNPTLLALFQFKLFQNENIKRQISAAQFLRKFANDCITARMKDIADGKVVPDDLLSILIKHDSWSLVDKIDEFITIFIAGQETTANALSFALYEIILNPCIEKKILNEVNEVLGERDYVEFDDLTKLKYLGQVFEESLRKFPVVSSPSRSLMKSLTVGGYYIPEGISVHTMQMFFGRNPEIWKDPEVFNPDRFANVENMPNFTMTHFPFSLGPRNCIGQTFAKFESKVIMAKLLRKFQFRLLPGQTDQMDARLTMSPRDGVMCEVAKRE
ncbi:cholesterol 24-hydroxylase-like [Dendronephthya gigantea]|uniref:cholesterol 24-hydroxylase-like n=1 Tax=Dendronephthya gigantea TaxID=151771 RepID=UPI00106BB8A3|nr:cholesterol 24-hydroxylase-like [Dendronephthya gigantea]